MTIHKPRSVSRLASTGIALSIGLFLAGCGGIASNRSFYSQHQPQVERTNYTLDVAAGPSGLSYPEQRRLAGWFEAMDLRYGDRIAIDDPMQSEATQAAVEALASRYGLLVGTDAPITAGAVNAGTARIVVTRSKASVPDCPKWSSNNEFNFNNGTSSNYGCAVNSNLAGMVADPEHLIKGVRSDSNTVVMSSTKAIAAYRDAKPSGADAELQAPATSGN